MHPTHLPSVRLAWSAPPPAVRLGPWRIRTFHLAGIVGYALAAGLAAELTGMLGLSRAVMALSAITGVGALLLLTLLSQLLLGREALVNFHHLIAVTVAAAGVARLTGEPLVPHLAAFTTALMVFQGCGRLGCLSAGCCHGRPGSIGVCYGPAHLADGFSPAMAGTPLVPVQALEAGWALLLAAAGSLALRQRVAPVDVLLSLVAGYAAGRFFAEFLRGDADRLRARGLSEPQWTALVLLLLAAMVSHRTHAAAALPVASLAVAVSLVGVGWMVLRVRQSAWTLLDPDHLLEIAGALQLVHEAEAGDAREGVRLATTSSGVTLSTGTVGAPASPGRHYTLSRRPTPLTDGWAIRLATIILRLRHPHQTATIHPGRSAGVYHLTVG